MKKFRFRFVVSYTYEIDLSEAQIYPDYSWRLCAEHADAYKKKGEHLTAARVMKTVRAEGGPSAILADWNLGPDFIEGAPPTGELDPDADPSGSTRIISRRVKLSVRPASRKRKPRVEK